MVHVTHGSAFPVELEERFAPKSTTPRVVPLGYLFPELRTKANKLLPDSTDTVDGLKKLAETMRAQSDGLRFSDVPAAYTYFGQFVAHDIAFFDLGIPRPAHMPSSCDFAELRHPLGEERLQAIKNKRSSQLQLDSIYEGAELTDAAHLRVGECTKPSLPHDVLPNDAEIDEFHDVPRVPADASPEDSCDPLIGDPRNDNNLIVSQLHVAFLRAHNALVDRERGSGPAQPEHFAAARTKLRQLYHHVIIDDFLKTIADEDVVNEVLRRPLRDPDAPDFCLPLEFTAAAFRFGHAMIRHTYYYNDRLPLVSFNALIPRVQMRTGGMPTPTLPRGKIMQWQRFVARRNGNIQTDNPNFARLIGPTLVMPLFTVLDEMGQPTQCEVNLAIMDLLRGYMLGLPTGQAIADELIAHGRNVRKMEANEVLEAAASHQQRKTLSDFGFDANTPLWFYVLAEAQKLGGGNKLGPVGSTIVAEVLISFVRSSVDSILPRSNGNATTTEDFKLPDLLRLAGVLS